MTDGGSAPIVRDRGILSGSRNLEHLFTLPDFPVFMGCVDAPTDQDRFFDLSFSICRDTGVIQIDLVPPAELVYLTAHNDAVGALWKRHHETLADFLLTQPIPGGEPLSGVLEIGGGSGQLWEAVHRRVPGVRWTIVDPNPLIAEGNGLSVRRGMFGAGLTLDYEVDAIVHSHVLEHIIDPEDFFRTIATYLQPDGLQVFSYPSMLEMLKRYFTSCMNFEHTVFLTEPFVDVLLARQGFSVLDKQPFGSPHSLFYAARYTGEVVSAALPDRYEEYKCLIHGFADYHRSLVARINAELSRFDGEVYLFGGHIFSQYLLAFGLDRQRIVGIIDNSTLKNGKRLYGTDLSVSYPDVLAGRPKVGVVLKVASYREEILAQLLKINPGVTIFE
ncbi:MAG: class I SAM-dependent methyltransferase [Alphaproteobacteria bacterium]|nr:class I SAM-dependent methyltransferase [Alphaproteobacteria bacterium]